MQKLLSILMIFMICNFCNVHSYTIRITCRSKGCEKELCEKAINEWRQQQKKKHKVEIVTLPHASNECFALYQQWLSAGTFDIDILQMDVAWVGIFSDYLEPLDHFYGEQETDDYFDAIKQSMYSDGKLVALPWYTDCGVMYYRKDLLAKYNRRVPETWEELYEIALYIQNEERKFDKANNKFYGFVFQAKAFEILTCNFVEFVDSFGGAIIKNGKVEVNSDRCIAATLFMVKCILNINSSGALNYSEEDARGVFQSGHAVFMRSWPYAWALMNEPTTAVAGKIGVMSIPKSANGGRPSGVLGGWFLAVSKYSKNKELAADLIKFLTSKAQQKMRAKYSYMPAFKSLYKDADVLTANPFFASLYIPLENAVTRPSIAFGKNYSKASSKIFNAINTVLTEAVENVKVDIDGVHKNLNRLQRSLSTILSQASTPKKKEINIFGKFADCVNSFINWAKITLGFKL